MVDNRMSALLERGFSKRMAREYQDILLKEEASTLFDSSYCAWAHAHGYFAESASAYQLSDDNLSNYLPDYEYYRAWPLNGWQRIWINDKLTLKTMLVGTEYDKYLPEYYFYTAPQGLMPLTNAHARGTIDAFLGVLRERGEFACKPANGERGVGFNKLSYADETYFIDNVEASADEVKAFVESHPNNVFTEFFHPGMGMEKISPVVHTLRVLTVNPTGSDPVAAASYLRFATGVGSDDSITNYRAPESEDICSFNTDFNLETGAFGGGRLVYGHKIVDESKHPDTGVEGSGVLPCWDEMRDMIMGLADRLNLVEYMGFDVCVTPSGPRLIEINSHSGCKYLQIFRPFMTDGYLSEYFSRKLHAIDGLDAHGIARRNAAVR